MSRNSSFISFSSSDRFDFYCEVYELAEKLLLFIFIFLKILSKWKKAFLCILWTICVNFTFYIIIDISLWASLNFYEKNAIRNAAGILCTCCEYYECCIHVASIL